MVYRRGEREMSAFKYERELAQKDGVTFLWNTQPVRIVGNGVVESLDCVRTRLHGDGRRARVEPIPGTEFTLPVDMVVRALGQQPMLDFIRSIQGVVIKDDCVVVDPGTGQTGNPKYFAGGDCVNGGKEVVDAVAEGMRAARGIDARLKPQMSKPTGN